MDQLVVLLNEGGRRFCAYAGAVFVQTAVLIAVLLIVDLLIRKRVRATFRYWMWMLVFIKLLLPPALALPTGVGYWIGLVAPAVAPAVGEPAPALTSPAPSRTSGLLPPRAPAEVAPTPVFGASPQRVAPTATRRCGRGYARTSSMWGRASSRPT